MTDPPDTVPIGSRPHSVPVGAVRENSLVGFHLLRIRPEHDSWIIGRIDSGTFITAPSLARQAITLLSDGHTVGQVRTLLLAAGHDVDVAGFVTKLVGLGFVSHLDGRLIDDSAPARPSLPWLRPRHVGWLLHPVTAVATAAMITGTAVLIAVDHALVPGYRQLIWSHSGGAVLLGNAAAAWVLIFLHELAHLATARAAGVPGRISLTTRLQFLAAQTDVSGVWAEPRRVRLTVYLAGMALNLLIFTGCVLAVASTAPSGLAHRLLAAVGLISLLSVPPQFLVFMRSDVYFALQDLTGCANLYADGSAYVRYQAGRPWHAIRRAPRRTDPSRCLPTRERRAVRAYAVLLLGGTSVCLTAAATTTLPAAITLLAHAIATIADGAAPVQIFDAVAVITVIGGFQILWARTWWRRHGHRVRRLGNRLRRQVHPAERR